MSLHPVILKMLEAARAAGGRPYSAYSPERLRATIASGRGALGTGPDMFSVQPLTLASRYGGLPARLYRPQADNRGLVVYLHGGGWMCGALDDYDALARALAHSSGFAVLLVDYRLAPEHRYPAGLEDVEDALLWAASEGRAQLGRNLPIVVAGDSAGANLGIAAVLALRARVRVALQCWFYPVTDHDFDRASYRDYSDGMPLTRDDMRWFFEHYAEVERWPEERISVLRSCDLRGAPPAWIATAEYDVLRDEGEAYAQRLRDAGVAVEHIREPGLTHGFVRMFNLVDSARASIQQAAAAIARHGGAGSGPAAVSVIRNVDATATMPSAPNPRPMAGDELDLDVVVVGAGFAGLYLVYRLRKLGLRVRVFEAGDDVGGTWHWNRYPGARCDVESIEYSFSFSEELQQEWTWSERYAGQEEILRYLNHVADRFDLRRHIALETRVTYARFYPAARRWTVRTQRGDEVTARYCVMATGNLSTPRVPDIPGIDTFNGRCLHTSAWPKEPIDFTGQRVGVVGTGSTGIQVIPKVAEQAQHLYVFQRTANYSIPLRNAPQDPQIERDVKSRYARLRAQARECPSGVASFNVPTHSALEVSPEDREAAYQERWACGGIGFTRAFNDVLFNEEANRTAAEFVVRKMHGVVKDPYIAQALTPTYPIGTKRLCADSGYYQTFNRDNVTLVDIRRAPIEQIGPDTVHTAAATYGVDALIFATGFDAMTGSLLAVDIAVEDGAALRELWSSGPRAYLGLMVAGLPNLFMVTGPGSPSVLSNVVVSIEQHVDWIVDCLAYLHEQGLDQIEAEHGAQETWSAHVDQVASTSLLSTAASWYTGANIPGKPRLFMPYMGGVGAFRAYCNEVVRDGYRGFVLTPAVHPIRVAGNAVLG